MKDPATIVDDLRPKSTFLKTVVPDSNLRGLIFRSEEENSCATDFMRYFSRCSFCLFFLNSSVNLIEAFFAQSETHSTQNRLKKSGVSFAYNYSSKPLKVFLFF